VTGAAVGAVDPAVRQFSAWLEVFNGGDRDRYAEFLAASFPSRLDSLDIAMLFRERTGGLDLRKLDRVSATEATALVQERDSDQFARLDMKVDAAEPHVISSLNVAAIPRPAEFAITRLTQDEAITGIQKVLSEADAANRFSGAVHVAKNGRALFSRAYGLADRERGIPNTQGRELGSGAVRPGCSPVR
jgi:D-alanyl-D-alanine carboxypeptidase